MTKIRSRLMTQNVTKKIDFRSYRSEELFETVSELIDYAGTLGRGFYHAFLGTVAFGVSVIAALCAISYLNHGFSRGLVVVAILMIVCLPSSLPAGTFYAIAYLIRRSLSNMLQVIDLLLDTTKRVAHDVNEMRSGNVQMPSARELVQGVYLEVFLPIVERVISEKLWIFGRPVLMLYRVTFGRLMRIVIRILPEGAMERLTEKVEERDIASAADKIQADMESLADNEARVVAALDWTKEKIKSIGARARLIVMLPCYVVCGVVMSLNLVVLLFYWWALNYLFLYESTSATT